MPLAPLSEPYDSDPAQLLALCIWREARGESIAAKYGVAWVIMNRCKMAPAQGFKHDVPGNILHPWAFSSFMEGDVNATKYPEPTDPSWQDSLTVAESVTRTEDPTNDAVFYFSLPLTSPPLKKDGTCAWGNVEHAASIGGLQFYRIPPTSVS